MIELYISQNKNTASEAYGKYYPRVSYKQTMGIHEMAVHLAFEDFSPHFLVYIEIFT